MAAISGNYFQIVSLVSRQRRNYYCPQDIHAVSVGYICIYIYMFAVTPELTRTGKLGNVERFHGTQNTGSAHLSRL